MLKILEESGAAIRPHGWYEVLAILRDKRVGVFWRLAGTKEWEPYTGPVLPLGGWNPATVRDL